MTQLLWGVCHDCKHKHPIELQPGKPVDNALNDWWTKHEGHGIEFLQEMPVGLQPMEARDRLRKLNSKRQERRELLASMWVDYRDNANVKGAYGSSAAYTISLASLASDTNLLAGRCGASVDNTSNLYIDYLLAANKVTTGTSPTGGQIELWIYGSYDDTPTYPDTLLGTDANKTLTNTAIKNAALWPWMLTPVTTSSNVAYPARPTSLMAATGGLGIPKFHGVFCVHNTGVNLNATGGNHVISYTGIFQTVI